MALRAGYYGVKRALKDKLTEIAKAWDATVASIFPRDEQVVMGAVNLLDVDANTSTQFEKNASGQMTNHTTDTLSTLDFVIQGRKNGSFVKYLVGSQSGHNYITSTGKYEFKFTIEDGDDINQLYIGHRGNTNNVMMVIPFTHKGTFYFSADFVGINPSTQNGYTMTDNMVALSSNSLYAPYAMTNRDLTLSAADQKTAINAIITAATGAADFAAFKAAMEAITPVTRSLSMASAPEEIVKDEIEEPIVEKKTTTRKKSTAKADTNEEV